MIVFAISDKGGTGRSVTGGNIVYRSALAGHDSCFVDFDFGSPTAGTIFDVHALGRGTESGRGTQSLLLGSSEASESLELWTASDSLGGRPPGAGRLVLFPGDKGGSEFSIDTNTVRRCARFLGRLLEEYELSVVDLSAGRSYAVRLVLEATADWGGSAQTRWLVFHRWTRQHVVAAHGLIHEARGILQTAEGCGHDRNETLDSLRTVRTAVMDPATADLSGLSGTQISWLRERHHDLQILAGELGLGRTRTLGIVPLDPILHWHEQILTEKALYESRIASVGTVQAFQELASALVDRAGWEKL
ncbi:MAG: hypothetical protein QG608_3527 [Actinomycetota bacterium]|nr:hypothetical protein [Actinomycetota bacterium]